MCSIFFAIDRHPDYALVLAANRDEFLDRPTQKMSWWKAPGSNKQILSGVDLQAGGTWLAIDRGGRWSAVTNIRDFRAPIIGNSSRGVLPKLFVAGEEKGFSLMENLVLAPPDYSGFNWLVGDAQAHYYLNNVQYQVEKLKGGIYGLSNAFLDTPWPKVEFGKKYLEQKTLSGLKDKELINALFSLLSNGQMFPIDALPDTGVAQDMEQALSAIRVQLPKYASRVSTVILRDYNGHIFVEERNLQNGEVSSFSWNLHDYRAEGFKDNNKSRPHP